MLTIGILTISDKGSRGERVDKSADEIRNIVSEIDSRVVKVVKYDIVPDRVDMITKGLIEWADSGAVDLILTTGGTGLSTRDVTPEATLSILSKVVPGLTEAMRMTTFKNTPTAILSRAVAGVRGKCLIINLPGSPTAVRECLEVVLPVVPHAVDIVKGVVTEHVTQSTGKD